MKQKIAIVGAGGIGSNLIRLLFPALLGNKLVESLGGIQISVFDSDVVDEANLYHQGFMEIDVGKTKVQAIIDSLPIVENQLVKVRKKEYDVNHDSDLDGYDITVVCVDSSKARMIVQRSQNLWLDLRCRGDNFLALDSLTNRKLVESLTDPTQEPGSCQFDDALETGNIQFGHLAASAHGCQWILQCLRQINCEEKVMLPLPKSGSITFGTLERFTLDN